MIRYVLAVQRNRDNGNADNHDDDDDDEDGGGERIGLAGVGLHDPLVGSVRDRNFQITRDGNLAGCAGAETQSVVLLEVNGLDGGPL